MARRAKDTAADAADQEWGDDMLLNDPAGVRRIVAAFKADPATHYEDVHWLTQHLNERLKDPAFAHTYYTNASRRLFKRATQEETA